MDGVCFYFTSFSSFFSSSQIIVDKMHMNGLRVRGVITDDVVNQIRESFIGATDLCVIGIHASSGTGAYGSVAAFDVCLRVYFDTGDALQKIGVNPWN